MLKDWRSLYYDFIIILLAIAYVYSLHYKHNTKIIKITFISMNISEIYESAIDMYAIIFIRKLIKVD